MTLLDERVRLFIKGEEISNIYKEYRILVSIFDQPSAFSLSLGSGMRVRELLERFKKHDPFELWIGESKIMTGLIDSRSAGGRETTVRFAGRSPSRELMRRYILEERIFQEETFEQLTRKVLDYAGLQKYKLSTDSATARRKFSGIDPGASKAARVVAADPRERAALVASAGLAGGIAGFQAGVAAAAAASLVPKVEPATKVREKATAKVGTSWWDFLQEQLIKGGLFLWNDVDGNFILSEPDPDQQPAFEIFRLRGADRNRVNVTDWAFEDGDTNVHRTCIVYGRAGERKKGRVKCRGDHSQGDDANEGVICFEDKGIMSDSEALYTARRRLAEERRNGYRLSYTIAGHRILAANQRTRAIPGPNLIAAVNDDEGGIYDPHFVHSVEFVRGDSGTTTQIHMMRPSDLIYAERFSAGA